MNPADVAAALPPGGEPGGDPPLTTRPKPPHDVMCMHGCGTVLHAKGVKVARLECGHLCMCLSCARKTLVTNPYCPACGLFTSTFDAVYVGVLPTQRLCAVVSVFDLDRWDPGRGLPNGARWGCHACFSPFTSFGDTKLTCAFPGCGISVHANSTCAGGMPPTKDGVWVCGHHLVGGAVDHETVLGPTDALRARLTNIDTERCSTCRKPVEPGRMIQCRECGWRGCKDHMVGTCECGRLACPVCTEKWRGDTRCVLCYADAEAAARAAEETSDVEEPVEEPRTSSEEEWDADDEDSDDDADEPGGGCSCPDPNPVDLQLCRVGCAMVCNSCASSCTACGKLVCEDHILPRCSHCAATDLCSPCYDKRHAKGRCLRPNGGKPRPPVVSCTWDDAHGVATTHCKRAACGVPICATCVCRIGGDPRGWCMRCVLNADSTAAEDVEDPEDADVG